MVIKTHKEGLALDPQSADPLNPKEGQLQIADGTVRAKGLWEYKNGAWSALTSALTTNGDILYYNSGEQRLAKGTDGQILQLASGLPSWTAPPSAADSVVSIDNSDSPYSVLTSTNTLLVDTSAGNVTINLYAASGNSGKKIKIVKTTSDTNTITIDGNGSETINGSLTTTVNTQYETLELQTDASNWFILGRKSDTEWTSYTPTNTQGFGTIANVQLYWKRVGDSMRVKGSFTNGTIALAEAQVELPTGYTMDSAKGVTVNLVGYAARGVAGATDPLTVLSTGGDTYFNFASSDGGNDPLLPLTASSFLGSGEQFSFFAEVPITGWKA